jgi:hypothetical protein
MNNKRKMKEKKKEVRVSRREHLVIQMGPWNHEGPHERRARGEGQERYYLLVLKMKVRSQARNGTTSSTEKSQGADSPPVPPKGTISASWSSQR